LHSNLRIFHAQSLCVLNEHQRVVYGQLTVSRPQYSTQRTRPPLRRLLAHFGSSPLALVLDGVGLAERSEFSFEFTPLLFFFLQLRQESLSFGLGLSIVQERHQQTDGIFSALVGVLGLGPGFLELSLDGLEVFLGFLDGCGFL
jgi:hypothetical protein